MSDFENWLKEKTGTDFFTFTTPREEVSPQSLFSRAVQNELGLVVIPKDRNLQLRDLLPVVIIETRSKRVMRGEEIDKR